MGRRCNGFVVAAFLALALVVAACGNDTKSTSSSTTTSGGSNVTTATGGSGAASQFANLKEIAAPSPCVNDPGVTDTGIKLGVIAVQSGPQAASFATALKGVQGWIDTQNASGGFGKRKVTLVTLDDAADAAKNLQDARQLVEQDNVFAVMELTPASAGSSAYLNDKGIPVVGWHVGVPDWGKYGNMFTFRLPAAVDQNGESTTTNAIVINKLGGHKVALVAGGNASSTVFINQIEASFKASPGSPTVVYKNTSVAAGDTVFTAIVQRIQSSGADTLFTGLDFLQNTALSQQLSAAGVHLKVILFPGGYSPLVLKLPGIEGAVFGLEFKPLEENTPDAVAFEKALPDVSDHAQVQYVGWLSAEIFSRGIEAAGVDCPTRKAFINNLRLVKGYTANGAFDPINFTDNFGHEFKCVYFVKVQNAAFVPLFNGQQVCGEPVKISI
jgi:branched-chain amino acid transport system substrate-binding protein